MSGSPFAIWRRKKICWRGYPLWQLIMNKGEAESSFLLWTYSGYQRGFDNKGKARRTVIFNMFIQVVFDFSLFKNTFLVHKKAKR